MKFKVGTKVRMILNDSWFRSAKEDAKQICTVVKIINDSYYIKVPNPTEKVDHCREYTWSVYERDLRVAEPEQLMLFEL